MGDGEIEDEVMFIIVIMFGLLLERPAP